MNAFALHDVSDQAGVPRWGASALAIVAAHAALLLLLVNWYTQPPAPGVAVPAVMVDLTPVSASPEMPPQDVAPGPVMTQADASPPDTAVPEAVQEPIAPTPPQEKPEVVAPPEQKEKPAPPKPEPARVTPEHKPTPVKPRVTRVEARRPSEAIPAPITSAPPRAEQRAPTASSANAGAKASAIAAYNQRVRAHLMRFHQYPAGANGQSGRPMVSFRISRGGQVTSSHVSGSGVAAIDAQAAAMLRQAQPFPPFPPEITDASLGFSIPVRFNAR